jgi:hypothetical protein
MGHAPSEKFFETTPHGGGAEFEERGALLVGESRVAALSRGAVGVQHFGDAV